MDPRFPLFFPSPYGSSGLPAAPTGLPHTGQQLAQPLHPHASGGMTVSSGLPLTWPPLTDPRQALFSPMPGPTPPGYLHTPMQPSFVDLLPGVPAGYLCSTPPWVLGLQQLLTPHQWPPQPAMPASSSANMSSSSSASSLRAQDITGSQPPAPQEAIPQALMKSLLVLLDYMEKPDALPLTAEVASQVLGKKGQRRGADYDLRKLTQKNCLTRLEDRGSRNTTVYVAGPVKPQDLRVQVKAPALQRPQLLRKHRTQVDCLLASLASLASHAGPQAAIVSAQDAIGIMKKPHSTTANILAEMVKAGYLERIGVKPAFYKLGLMAPAGSSGLLTARTTTTSSSTTSSYSSSSSTSSSSSSYGTDTGMGVQTPAGDRRYTGLKSHKRKFVQPNNERPVHRMPPGFSSSSQPNPFASLGHEDLFSSELESLENFNSTSELLQEQSVGRPASGDTAQAPRTGAQRGTSSSP